MRPDDVTAGRAGTRRAAGSRPGLGAVLFPGAGGGRDQGALVSIDHALSDDDVRVERIDFPYRVAGRRRPDRREVLVAAVVAAATGLAEQAGLPPTHVLLGGRSMGGRICSVAAAEGLPAAGLALVSYPLHPPGRPDRPRTEHFAGVTVPCLFVSGPRDAFATPGELEQAVTLIPAPVTLVFLESGDHGLRGHDAEVADIVRDWVRTLPVA